MRFLSTDDVGISPITFGEVYDGIYHGTDPRRHEAGFLDLLRRVQVLPLDQAIMRRLARIRGDLRRRGLLIGDPDLVIAATALHCDAILVSRNHGHFHRVPGLKLL